MGNFDKSMVKLDVLTHEINNSGHIMQNNSIVTMCDGAMLYPIVHSVPGSPFLHKSIMGHVRITFVVTRRAK